MAADLEAFASAMQNSFGDKKLMESSINTQSKDDGATDDPKKTDEGGEEMDTSWTD